MKSILKLLGYKLTKVRRSDLLDHPITSDMVTTDLLPHRHISDVDKLADIARSIPGMVDADKGRFLYALALLQSEKGDIVEIGSWQGRSSSFLARASQDSGNGKFIAIDHFRGNTGKERFYVVGENDLSDLESNFLRNMEKIGLGKSVKLINSPSQAAADEIQPSSVRLLFVDGDHSENGIRQDLALFLPKLVPEAIVIFDDFSRTFPGVLKVIEEYFDMQIFSQRMCYKKTLVVKMRRLAN